MSSRLRLNDHEQALVDFLEGRERPTRRLVQPAIIGASILAVAGLVGESMGALFAAILVLGGSQVWLCLYLAELRRGTHALIMRIEDRSAVTLITRRAPIRERKRA